MPKTKAGKLAVGLLSGSVLFLIVFVIIVVAMGQRGEEFFLDNLYLGAITLVFLAVFGIASFFVGIYAIVQGRERSVMVYITVFIGFLVTLFIGAELIFPY